ncbi:MAG TPA: hypothetical protein VK972_01655 [Wenzhouxiangella sp.]|nr:hypothetical protein [Wenzhouxiangella sp.]
MLVTAIVVPVALCVFAFLGVACYFALRNSLSPALAALVTAASGVIVIALVLIIAKIADPASRRAVPARGQSGDDEFERFLRDHADPVLARWIQDNPDKAAITTLGLGIAAGYSEPFRRVLSDLYIRYSESESVRRGRDR